MAARKKREPDPPRQLMELEASLKAAAPGRLYVVRGEERYYVDFDRCLPYFMEHNGCGICAAACPYSRPEVRPRVLKSFERRRRSREESG